VVAGNKRIRSSLRPVAAGVIVLMSVAAGAIVVTRLPDAQAEAPKQQQPAPKQQPQAQAPKPAQNRSQRRADPDPLGAARARPGQ
jgi:hypothetical protein